MTPYIALAISALMSTTLLFLMLFVAEWKDRDYYEREMLRYRDMWDEATWKRPDRKDDRP